MNGKRQHIIAFYIGFLLIIAGFVSGRFLIVRPNRIESGTGIGMLAAFKDTFGLWAALFLFAAIMAFFSIRSGFRRPGLLALMLCILLAALVGLTGLAAKDALTGMESPARASLGFGFWLIFSGILLMIQGAAKIIDPQGSRAALILFAGLSACIWFMYAAGWLGSISIVKEISSKSGQFGYELLRHLHLSLASALTGLALSLAFSYWAYRRPGLRKIVTAIANGAQVIPTLSLLGMIMIPLAALATRFPVMKMFGISGIGFFPAFIALTLYTLLPITASTLAGFNSIDANILLSARAMGMSRAQMLARVELPMASPAILSGFKTALVQTVGNCILAGMVAGGGLGSLLFLGLAQSAPDLVVAASLSVVFLAMLLNIVMAALELLLKRRYGDVAVND